LKLRTVLFSITITKYSCVIMIKCHEFHKSVFIIVYFFFSWNIKNGVSYEKQTIFLYFFFYFHINFNIKQVIEKKTNVCLKHLHCHFRWIINASSQTDYFKEIWMEKIAVVHTLTASHFLSCYRYRTLFIVKKIRIFIFRWSNRTEEKKKEKYDDVIYDLHWLYVIRFDGQAITWQEVTCSESLGITAIRTRHHDISSFPSFSFCWIMRKMHIQILFPMNNVQQ